MDVQQIACDTEPTGVDHHAVDRVIEVGCILLVGRQALRVHS